MSSVKPVVPTLSHIIARPRQSQNTSSASSSSGARSVPHLHIAPHPHSRPQTPSHSNTYPQPHSNDPMSYRSSTSAHPQKPWPLTPSASVPSPLSASASSSYYHHHPGARHPSRNVSEIIARLYISDLSFVENPSLLSSYRITHILSATSDTVVRPTPSQLPFQPMRLHIRVEDLPFAELAAHLPTTTSFIRNALSVPEARIVVHCAEGISRSVSVVAAYLMAAYGWAPTEAVAYIKGKRAVANPNFGFVQQLHEYARNELGRSIPNPVPPSYPPAS